MADNSPASGNDDDKVPCPLCKGDGTIRAGHVTCPGCHGDKKVTPAAAAQIKKGNYAEGVELRPGRRVELADSGSDDGSDNSVDCPLCKGKGSIRDGHVTCPGCKGKKQVSPEIAAKIKSGKYAETYQPKPYHADPDETVTCPKCGKQNDTDARFCDQCGTKLAGNPDVKVEAAELDADARNKLKASDFAFVDSNGKGHLPIHDQGHVRAALSRFNQTQFPDAGTKKKAAQKIKRVAKGMGVDVGDDSDVGQAASMSEPWVVALPFSEADFAEGQPVPFLRVGEHTFPDYGAINIDAEKLDQVVRNFKNGVRRQDVPVVNEEHTPATYDEAGDTVMGPGAIGYIADLYRDGDCVWAVPNWNAAGERIMADDRYRGTSPELMLNWTDPETLESHGLTAVGLALTNRPRMKSLAVRGRPLDSEVAASEPRILAFADVADVHVDGPMQGLSISYAYPDRKRLPLHSAEAVKGAKNRFMAIDASEKERDDAWQRIVSAGQEHGVPLPSSWRTLKASDVAHALMAEDDDGLPGSAQEMLSDIDSGQLPPCIYQPPFATCHGYTRSDPDGDGDADVCLMAGRSCNGYVPITTVGALNGAGASLGADQPVAAGPAWLGYSEQGTTPKEQQQMAEDTEREDQDQEEVQASETDGEQESHDGGTPPEQEPHVAADFAELQNLFLAEQRRNRDNERRLQLAERDAKAARAELQRQEEARKLAEVQTRLDNLIRTGRCTPAEVQVYAEDGLMVLMAENPKFLNALEARPANSAVEFGERGSGEFDDGSISNSDRLHRAAIELMEKRGQDTSRRTGKVFSENYRAALLDAGKNGYGPARA